MTCSLYECVVILLTTLMTTMYVINMKTLRYCAMSWNWTRILLEWFEHNYMDANPSKFQGIILGKDVPQSMTLLAQSHDVPLSNHLKVLGVTLDHKLNFDLHIGSVCLSASRRINALKRLSRFLDEDSRVLIYKSFVLSNFSYSPITWIYCGKRNKIKLERLQERALRSVYRGTTSTNMVMTYCINQWGNS